MEEQPVFFYRLYQQNKSLRCELYNNSTWYHKADKKCLYKGEMRSSVDAPSLYTFYQPYGKN